jgi:hypothetical protein
MDSNKKVLMWTSGYHDDSRVLSICVSRPGTGLRRESAPLGAGEKSIGGDALAMDESGTRICYIVQRLCDDIQFNPVGNAITVRKRLRFSLKVDFPEVEGTVLWPSRELEDRPFVSPQPFAVSDEG